MSTITEEGALNQKGFVLRPDEFEAIRSFLFEHTGISLSEAKQDLVSSRLAKRLRHFGLRTFGDYLSLFERKGSRRRITAIHQLHDDQ